MVLPVVVITFWKLKGEWRGAHDTTDRWGIVMCIAAQGLVCLACPAGEKSALSGQFCRRIAIMLAIFYIFEKKHANPLIPVDRIFKNRCLPFQIWLR
jgi:hypothetical protein